MRYEHVFVCMNVLDVDKKLTELDMLCEDGWEVWATHTAVGAHQLIVTYFLRREVR